MPPILPENMALVYEKLKTIRASKSCVLKPTPMLRKEIVDLAGNVVPSHLRYYQVQAVLHMLHLKRMILGDSTGVGKTASSLATLCYLWGSTEPDAKVIVVAPKSALRQWGAEIDKFTTGITSYIVSGTLNERKVAYAQWAAHDSSQSKAVLILNYPILIRDWDYGAKTPTDAKGKIDPKKPVIPGLLNGLTKDIKNLTVVLDEASAFKSTTTKTWQTCRFLSERANRCYGLTATLLKNNLMEGFGIYKVVAPPVFGNKAQFMNDYCVTRMQPVGGGRKVPIVVGYKNLQHFRDRIDPYFLGRAKHEISSELPSLITKEITFDLSEAEDAKYEEALSGVMELGDGEVKDFEEYKAFVSLIYCQQVVDSLHLLKFDGESEITTGLVFEDTVKPNAVGTKEQTLIDLLGGELEDEKVIVYTRFASLVPRLQSLLLENGIKSTCITGQVKDTAANPARKRAQDLFQDLKSDTKVIIITDAGSEAINLQAASAMVFYDNPWSWGNYVQLIGRAIRIGSIHQHVVVYHLIAERPKSKVKDRKTIDAYTLELLGKKKALIDSVLGESAVGALTFEKDESMSKELIKRLKAKATV